MLKTEKRNESHTSLFPHHRHESCHRSENPQKFAPRFESTLDLAYVKNWGCWAAKNAPSLVNTELVFGNECVLSLLARCVMINCADMQAQIQSQNKKGTRQNLHESMTCILKF